MNDKKLTQEWKDRGDDVETFPIVVVYKDKRTFPASWYYKTLNEAKADSRPIETITVRKYDANGCEVARILESR